MGSLSLGARLEEEVELYAEVGPYGNKSEVVRRALEQFFSSLNKETRMMAALQAYKTRKATITRAAEVGGVSYEEMRERLRNEGILEEGAPSGLLSDQERSRRAKSLAERAKRSRG